MNIFKSCCGCNTRNTEEDYEVVSNPSITNVANENSVVMETVQPSASPPPSPLPSTSASASVAGDEAVAAPRIQTPPPPVVVPALVHPPQLTVSSMLICPFASDLSGFEQSGVLSLRAEHITTAAEKLKQIYATAGMDKDKIKLKNAIHNGGYATDVDKACQHLAYLMASSKAKAQLSFIDEIEQEITRLINECGCDSSDEDEHDIHNHYLEDLLCGHVTMDLASEQIQEFCEAERMAKEDFLMKLSDCSEYMVEKALREIKGFKIDIYTDWRLKNIFKFSLSNEVHFRILNPEIQVNSEIVKNNAINTISVPLLEYAQERSYELKDIVMKVVDNIVKDLTLPVENSEEIFHIMHAKINKQYLNELFQ